MKNKRRIPHRRKQAGKRAGYAFGFFFLAAAFACAFFLPAYYSRLQERQLLNHIHMEQRQQTEFPNKGNEVYRQIVEKMSFITRNVLFVQGEKDEMVWNGKLVWKEEKQIEALGEIREHLDAQVKEWLRFGMLPEAFMQEYEESVWSNHRLIWCEQSRALYWIQMTCRGGVVLDFILDEDGSCRIELLFDTFRSDAMRFEIRVFSPRGPVRNGFAVVLGSVVVADMVAKVNEQYGMLYLRTETSTSTD